MKRGSRPTSVATSCSASGSPLAISFTTSFTTSSPTAFGPLTSCFAWATQSYAGLGFPDPSVSWGVMLQEAANVAAISDAPWTLAPAAAIFVVVLAGSDRLHQGYGGPPELHAEAEDPASKDWRLQRCPGHRFTGGVAGSPAVAT